MDGFSVWALVSWTLSALLAVLTHRVGGCHKRERSRTLRHAPFSRHLRHCLIWWRVCCRHRARTSQVALQCFDVRVEWFVGRIRAACCVSSIPRNNCRVAKCCDWLPTKVGNPAKRCFFAEWRISGMFGK